MRWHRRRSPEGVHLIYRDGSESDPLPLVYLGRDRDGIDQWEAMCPPFDGRTVVQVRIDRLPAWTSVEGVAPRQVRSQ